MKIGKDRKMKIEKDIKVTDIHQNKTENCEQNTGGCLGKRI